MNSSPKGIIVTACFLLGIMPAIPSRANLPTSSIGTIRTTAKNDPVHIISCDGAFPNGDRGGNYVVSTHAFNRYEYDLVEYEVHYRFFDIARHLIYEQTWTYTKDLGGNDLDVAPGEQTAASGLLGFSMGIANMKLITSLDCKAVSAKFADSSAWKAGTPWHGKVYHAQPPAASSTSTYGTSDGGSGDVLGANDYAKIAGLKATVTATWHSLARGDQWVHIRFMLSATKAAVLRASDFVATMSFATGGTKSFVGMTEASSLVPKGDGNALAQESGDAPAVASSEDLGSLGSVTVGPGGGATVVVTFHVPDELNPLRPVQSIAISAHPN